jgi:multiple sugar transport system permease protein
MRARQSTKRQEKLFRALSISPALLIILLLGLCPALYTFVLSFTRYELVDPPARFIGLLNYANLFLTQRYIHAVVFTIVFGILATAVELLLGFFIAYLLADKHIPESYSAFIRTLLLIPFVIAPVVSSYTFKTLIFDTNYGYLNHLLRLLHLPTFDIFHGTLNAPLAILITEVFLRTPFMTLILYAGISSIDTSIYDAAEIDGVNWLQKMSRIIVPLILPVIAVGTVLRFMGTLRIFEMIYVITAGGPGSATENFTVFTVRQAFDYYHMGFSAASSFFFILVTALIVSVFMRNFRSST